MSSLPFLASNLVQGDHGCWFSNVSEQVSYPSKGNEACFSVEDDSFWFQHRNRFISHVVQSYPPGGPLFDVGGGNGYVAAGLAAQGLDVVLVEPGRIGAENARKRGLRYVISATLESAGFMPGSISAVGLFDVLEHVDGDVAFLRMLHSLLVPDGKLYLTVPAHEWLWSAEDDAAGHVRRYTLNSLMAKLQLAGFSVDFKSYMFAFLPVPLLFFRTLPSRLGLRRPLEEERMRQDHVRTGWGRVLVQKCLNAELRLVHGGRTIPWGTSCIVAARKKASPLSNS